MDAKQNFYIAITILKEQGKTLKAIADFFSSENRQVEGMSESNISRAKPEWGPSSGTWKSAFTDKRLRVMITHLNEMLEYECRITWNEVGEYYENGGKRVEVPLPEQTPKEQRVADAFGIINVIPSLPKEDIFKRIRSAKRLRTIQTFFTSLDDFSEAMEELLKKEGEIEVLLVDPYGHAATLRQKSLQMFNFREEVQQTREKLMQLKKEYPSQLFIKEVDESPSVELYMIDARVAGESRMFCGFFLCGMRAKSSSYLEMQLDRRFSQVSTFMSHYDNLWKQGRPLIDKSQDELVFRCHFIRDNKYQNFTLVLDPGRKHARMTGTPSGHEFSGYLEQVRRFVTLHLQTTLSNQDPNRRIASFLISANINDLKDAEMLLGLMQVIPRNDRLSGNLVVLTKENVEIEAPITDKPSAPTCNEGEIEGIAQAEDSRPQPKPEKESDLAAIETFLRNTELTLPIGIDAFSKGDLTNYLDSKDAQWEIKHALYKAFEGDYLMFYAYKLKSKETTDECIACRPLRINANGKGIKTSLGYTNKLQFNITPLNNRSVLMAYQPDRGTTSAFLIMQFKNHHNCDPMVGRMIGFANSNEIITNWVFVKKRVDEDPIEPQDYTKDDEYIQKVLQNHPEFQKIINALTN